MPKHYCPICSAPLPVIGQWVKCEPCGYAEPIKHFKGTKEQSVSNFQHKRERANVWGGRKRIAD